MGALLQHRCARQAARLATVRQCFDTFTAQRGVGGDHRIHARLHQRSGHQRRFFVAHVRRDLDCQGHALAMCTGQLFAALGQGVEQLLERVAELQAAQARGIGRADVDRDVAGGGVDLVQADQVVIDSTFDRGIEVLADVDAQHPL